MNAQVQMHTPATVDPGSPASGSQQLSARTSSLYRPGPWPAAVHLARRWLHFVLGRLAVHGAQAYWAGCAARRHIVHRNVLPVVNGDRLAARIATRELFAQFGLKLADLWRYESGLSVYNLFHSLTGW